MVNWSKMLCRQAKATRRKRFKFVTLNIYCFYPFKNIRECQRGNASKAIDHCNIAIVSRDWSRLRTSRAIMLCGKEIVNTCVRAEMDLFCRHPTTSYTGQHYGHPQRVSCNRINHNHVRQGWANIFYGGQHWRFYCNWGPHARITYIYYICNRFENFKNVLHELPQTEGNNSHFRLNKNAVSNETCGKKLDNSNFIDKLL